MLIKGGRVVDPATGTDGVLDVLIGEGRILAVGKNLALDEPALDASGLVVAPGLIDTHVHFRDPGFTHKEDLHTGALSAAAGGYTSVVCMANTNPAVDSPEVLSDILARAAREKIHIYQAAAVTRGLQGETLTDMEALMSIGALFFTDDGVPIQDSSVLYAAMIKSAQLGSMISLHEEDLALLRGTGINEGTVSQRLGIPGAAAVAENALVARDCMMALATGAHIIIQHISSAEAVAMVRFARSLGAKIDAEATPHHFTLTEDVLLMKGSLAKMNPPLRTEADRRALIEGLKDGTISIIATDHAPHTKDEKAKPLTDAPSGIIGLETALALGITHLVEPGHLTLPQLISCMSAYPAAMLGIDGGQLRTGAAADLVLFDSKRQWKVEKFASKSSNSPFLGEVLTGKVIHTICRGKIVYSIT